MSVLLIMEHVLTFGILHKTPTHPQELSESTKSTFMYLASSTPNPSGLIKGIFLDRVHNYY